MKEDGRRYPRANVEWPVTLQTERGSMDSIVLNISGGGVFFRCNELVPKGETLGMTLKPPNYTPLEVSIETVWTDMYISADKEIKPIGLGARDTLRLEKCFLLAGNEFEGGRTPLEANLSWAINWDHDFIGKEALLKQKEAGDFQRLTCLQCTGRGIPRHGMNVEKNGKKIGVVSSGSMSPCLNTGIAMAYLDHGEVKLGDTVDILIRNKSATAEVVKPPFVKQDWAKTH